MTTMSLTSITAREKRELEDIKRRCLTELEKAHKRKDKETVRLLTYILRGATFGQTRRPYRPKVRDMFMMEDKANEPS